MSMNESETVGSREGVNAVHRGMFPGSRDSWMRYRQVGKSLFDVTAVPIPEGRREGSPHPFLDYSRIDADACLPVH